MFALVVSLLLASASAEILALKTAKGNQVKTAGSIDAYVPESGPSTYTPQTGFSVQGWHSHPDCIREYEMHSWGYPIGQCVAANREANMWVLAFVGTNKKDQHLQQLHFFSDNRCTIVMNPMTVPAQSDVALTTLNQCEFVRNNGKHDIYITRRIRKEIPTYYVGTLLKQYNSQQDCRSKHKKDNEGLTAFAYFRHGTCNPEGYNPFPFLGRTTANDFSIKCFLDEETFFNTFETTDGTCSSADPLNRAIGLNDNDYFCKEYRSLNSQTWGYVHFKCV